MSQPMQSSPSGGNKAVSSDQCAKLLEKLRSDCPLVQCITNYVSMDIMANTLLAIGASPAMAHGELCPIVCHQKDSFQHICVQWMYRLHSLIQ